MKRYEYIPSINNTLSPLPIDSSWIQSSSRLSYDNQLMAVSHIFPTCISNHRAVVNKKRLFWDKKLCISFFAHDCAHFLKTLIASYSAAEKQFFFPRVSHCPFS